MNIIEAEHICKAFDRHVALDDVSLSIPEGKIFGLLGPNGAGKTTFIRIINHITAPDSGAVMFNGHPLSAKDVVNIGYLPEERGLYKKMKVGEQAIFFARLKGLSRAEATKRLKEWFERFEIESWWGRKVEELSKGMAQKVQFIVTVLHNPQLLIFDEPFSGFDPINANLLKNEILRLRDNGATVIFSTHNMSSVDQLCDNITLINRSRNILSGDVSEIRRKYSGHNFQITFTGDVALLRQEVQPFALFINPEDGKDDLGNNVLTVELKDSDARRPMIDAINRTVDIVSIQQKVLSMDDIFIKTVQDYNNPIPPQFDL